MKSATLYTPKRFFSNFCFGKKLKQKQKQIKSAVMRFSFLVLRVLLRFKAFHYSFNENQIEKRIE